MVKKINGWKTAVAGLAAGAAILAGGCSASSQRTALRPTMPEGDPIASQVVSVRGLAAADTLGQVLFVEEGHRFASARAVYQMASAEAGGLARVDDSIFPTVNDRPVQVIVSAEELRRERELAAAQNGQSSQTPAASVVTEVQVSPEQAEPNN
jgi:hypothetical protein